ncbi:hypothetical protein PRNP1_000182 [Phytophthora ramorum]
MLRLVSAARRRLLSVGAIRVAGVLAPQASSLAVTNACLQYQSYQLQTSRFSSSSRVQDGGSWTTLAVRNPVAWQQAARPAFHTFLQLKKHLMVPVKFCVPDQDEAWPEAAWGYPLGQHAQWLRKQWRRGKMNLKQQKELDEMSFAWDTLRYRWDHFVLPALRRFYELNGHTEVPDDFIIPKGDPEWPDHLWGQLLGKKVTNIRCRGDFAKQVTRDMRELENIDFVWDFSEVEWSERILPSLEVFHRENSHCRVPKGFVVPSNDRWPKQSWGLKLGTVVGGIRSHGTYRTQVSRDRSQLDAISFVWDVFEVEWSERILPALKVFFRVHGHLRVPASFVVPSDAAWPEEVHGLKVGYAVNNIRGRGSYFDQAARSIDELEAIEFGLQIPVVKWEQRVEPLLAMFEQLHGHRNVPVDFVIPTSAPWEEKDWGIPLAKLRRKEGTQEIGSSWVA